MVAQDYESTQTHRIVHLNKTMFMAKKMISQFKKIFWSLSAEDEGSTPCQGTKIPIMLHMIPTCMWWMSPVAEMVKNLPAMQETRVPFRVGKSPLEKGMATHSSILAWKIPWIKEPDRLQPIRSQRVGHDWTTNKHFHFHPGNFISRDLNSDFFN